VYESKDGGKTTKKIGDQGAYFVMIGAQGSFYTATQVRCLPSCSFANIE
jgi:hypothetical protein